MGVKNELRDVKPDGDRPQLGLSRARFARRASQDAGVQIVPDAEAPNRRRKIRPIKRKMGQFVSTLEDRKLADQMPADCRNVVPRAEETVDAINKVQGDQILQDRHFGPFDVHSQEDDGAARVDRHQIG